MFRPGQFGPGRPVPGIFGPKCSKMFRTTQNVLPWTFWTWMFCPPSPDILDLQVSLLDIQEQDISNQDISPPDILEQDVLLPDFLDLHVTHPRRFTPNFHPGRLASGHFGDVSPHDILDMDVSPDILDQDVLPLDYLDLDVLHPGRFAPGLFGPERFVPRTFRP